MKTMVLSFSRSVSKISTVPHKSSVTPCGPLVHIETSNGGSTLLGTFDRKIISKEFEKEFMSISQRLVEDIMVEYYYDGMSFIAK